MTSNNSIGFVVLGSYKVAAQDRARFTAIAKRGIQTATNASGNVYYAFAVDLLDDTVFRMSEGWVDEAHLASYMSGRDFTEILQDLQSVTVLERVAHSFSVSNPNEVSLPSSPDK